LGTLIIGLRATDQEYKFDDGGGPPSRRTPSHRLERLRSSFAAALRWLAEHLDPGTIEPAAIEPEAAS
jgi:hypothetical protein